MDQKKSLTLSFQVLEHFRTVSGLKLNNKKTEVLWIGANTGRDEILCPEKKLKWVKDKVKALGVWFSTDPKVTIEANYSDRLANVNECLGSWEYRRLSLFGKITVLKSLIASKLVYILSPLPTNYRVLKELSKSFLPFFMERQRGQNQAECDHRRLFRRRSKDDRFRTKHSNQVKKIP